MKMVDIKKLTDSINILVKKDHRILAVYLLGSIFLNIDFNNFSPTVVDTLKSGRVL